MSVQAWLFAWLTRFPGLACVNCESRSESSCFQSPFVAIITVLRYCMSMLCTSLRGMAVRSQFSTRMPPNLLKFHEQTNGLEPGARPCHHPPDQQCSDLREFVSWSEKLARVYPFMERIWFNSPSLSLGGSFVATHAGWPARRKVVCRQHSDHPTPCSPNSASIFKLLVNSTTRKRTHG